MRGAVRAEVECEHADGARQHVQLADTSNMTNSRYLPNSGTHMLVGGIVSSICTFKR